MDEFFSLFLDSPDNLGVAVPGRNYCNASRKIKKPVPIHIPNFRTSAMIHDEWIGTRV
jgi:hypothetical protein